jgi:hypothetical protein
MKIFTSITCAIIIVSFISSCGVITRTRYGNGLKLNVELDIFQKGDKVAGTPKGKKKPVDVAQRHSLSKEPSELRSPDFEKVPVALAHHPDALDNTIITGSSTRSVTGKSGYIHKAIQVARQKINPGEPARVNYDDRPMERNVRIGAWLFFGGLIMALIPVPYVSALAGFFTLVGFIFAIIGLGNIRMSGGGFKGRGLGRFIVSFYIAFFLLALAVVLIFVAA